MPFERLGELGGTLGTDPISSIGPVNLRDTMLLEEGAAILSQNFVSGSTGFRMQYDGAAEFNDVTIRGTLNAVDITGASTITSALFRTAASGARLEINGQTADSYITLYNASAAVGYMGLGVPTLGSTELAIRTSSSLNSIRLKSDGAIYLEAGGLSGTGVIIADTPAGASPSYPFRVWDGSDNKILDFSTRPQLQAADGSVSYPIYSFTGDVDCGIFRNAADDWRLVAGGASVAQVINNGTFASFGPGADNTYSLGRSGLRWTAVWAVNGTIQTSDMREKALVDYDVPGLEFIRSLNPLRFRWKVGPATDHIHWGLSAQEVQERVGNTGPMEDGDLLGLRYSELVPSLINAVRELADEVDRLSAMID